MALRLPRISALMQIVDAQGRPSPQFMQMWQNFAASIEAEFGAIAAAQLAQAAAASAQASANTAQIAADAAAGAADDIAENDALRQSYVTGLTSTASDAGASATITLSAHTREYGDGTSAAVTGGALTGLLYNTAYWVGYVQASRLGGVVTYTASAAIRGNGTLLDYHLVASILTPVAASPNIEGTPALPPGAVIP